MSIRILHLEDSDVDAALVEGHLAAAGLACAITCVAERLAFERAVDEGAFDIVLSDNSLPSFDGLTALQLVRQRDPHVPFIFLSGTMGEETAVRSLTAGATDYILKGKMARLPAAISRALESAQHRREREKAENALRTSEARYRALVETASDWIWAIDRDGVFTFCSPAAERVTGYTPHEMVGHQWQEFVTAEDVGPAVAALAHAAAHQLPVQGHELRARHRDGSLRDLEACAVPVRNGDGSLAGFQGTTRDVTERKRLERELRQIQKLEVLGSFAASIAHDFNNLLGTMMACSQLALDDLPADSPVRPDVKSIERAAQHGATLTRQLLAFSRQQPIEPTLVNVGDLIGSVEQLVRRLVGSHMGVIVSVDAALPRVRADRGQLEQIVLNLASNARDSMPRGGTLTIEAFPAHVLPEDRRRYPDAGSGPHVVLAIRDTGTGIDEATLSRMFEPFFTTKEQGRGTGLGLSTVYGIVAQAGGHIRIDTAIGKGTSVLVYYPAAIVGAAAP